MEKNNGISGVAFTCRLAAGLVLTGSIDRNTISLVFVSPDTQDKKCNVCRKNYIYISRCCVGQTGIIYTYQFSEKNIVIEQQKLFQ